MFTFWITKESVSLKFYIDRGKDTDEENLSIFNRLHENKVEIEDGFGEKLDWKALEGYRTCVVFYEIKDGGYKDESKWEEVQDKAIDHMIKMEGAFKPQIKKLKM